MMINPLRFLGILALATSAAAISAQTWTYQECVDYARINNISLRKSILAEQTSAYDLEAAKAAWQPSLDFATSHNYANYPWANGTRNGYNSNYSLSAGWNVWNGGERENTIKRNELQTKIQSYATTELFRTLETDLLQAYLNILYARESIGIYEEAAKVSLAQAERAKAMMESGKISRVDYANLASQHEQDNYALVNARGTYDTRRMELKQLLELGLDTNLTLADVEWTAEQVLAELPPIAQSYELALQTDVRIRGLETQKSAAEVDIDIAKAGRMPRLSLNAGIATGYNAPGAAFGSSMKRNFNEGIGLTLAVPILDNKKTKTAVAKARIQQIDSQLDIDKRRTELAQYVENWYIDTRSAQARFKAALQQLEAARLSDELNNEKFQVGYVNTVELMTAHNSFIEARHTVLQSKYMAILGQKMIEFYRTANVTLN